MSLGTDQGFLMSPELLRVAERAQHDPQSGGRHPGVSYFGSGSGRGPQRAMSVPAAGDGASVTSALKGFRDALVRRATMTRKRP